MNVHEYLLTTVGEECSETHHRCSKALKFGWDEVQIGQTKANKDRILYEFNDLLASMEMLYETDIEELINRDQMDKKAKKIKQYMRYSRKQGTLT